MAPLLLLPWPHVREEDRLTVRVRETLFTRCKEGQIKRSFWGQSREDDAIGSVSVLSLNICSDKYEVNSCLINRSKYFKIFGYFVGKIFDWKLKFLAVLSAFFSSTVNGSLSQRQNVTESQSGLLP